MVVGVENEMVPECDAMTDGDKEEKPMAFICLKSGTDQGMAPAGVVCLHHDKVFPFG